jgi:hypothetical protein
MPSKLDYLQKYSEPKKKKKRRREESDIDPSTFGIHNLPEADQAEDIASDKDDGPVVVPSNEIGFIQQAANLNRQSADVMDGDKRRRYDSEDEPDELPSRPSRKRHDSSDDEKPIARRCYDSSDEDYKNEKPDTVPSKRRYDSSDDHESDKSPIGRRRHDSSDESSISAERMSSGHRSGLQTGKAFSKTEQELQQQRTEDAQRMVDLHGVGETVYRKKQEEKKGLSKQEQRELNMG